jgi:hypothetical protein
VKEREREKDRARSLKRQNYREEQENKRHLKIEDKRKLIREKNA